MHLALVFLPFTAALYRILPCSPDGALVLATLGLCLIFLELNRPGWILPGALGLALVLVSVPPLLPGAHLLWAVTLLILSAAICVLHLWFSFTAWTSAVATILLILAFRLLLRGSVSSHMHWITAVVCGGLIGSLSTMLARVARHAREAKHVTAKQVN